jgi:hypothetical protein
MWTWMLLHWRCEAQLACSWLAASGGGAVFSAASRVLPWLCPAHQLIHFARSYCFSRAVIGPHPAGRNRPRRWIVHSSFSLGAGWAHCSLLAPCWPFPQHLDTMQTVAASTSFSRVALASEWREGCPEAACRGYRRLRPSKHAD